LQKQNTEFSNSTQNTQKSLEFSIFSSKNAIQETSTILFLDSTKTVHKP